MPQGGCLSPSLFSYYTHDLPRRERQNCNVIYADDVTQVVRYPGKSHEMLRRETEGEIRKINEYEKKWKIRTNLNKFHIVPIEGTRPLKIRVNNQEIEYSKETKALGLTIKHSGFSAHATNRIHLARTQLAKFYRVRNLSLKNKRMIYLTIVRSVLLYPTVPLHVQSQSQQNKLQIIQNKAARLITGTRKRECKTNEEVNTLAGLESIKTYLDRQAKSIWEKIGTEIDVSTLAKLHLYNNQLIKYPSSRGAVGH